MNGAFRFSTVSPSGAALRRVNTDLIILRRRSCTRARARTSTDCPLKPNNTPHSSADALEGGFSSKASIMPRTLFSALYTYGHRCSREDDYCDELAQHHQDKIQEYLR